MNRALERDKVHLPTRYAHLSPSGSPRTGYTKEEPGRLIQHSQKIVRFCSGLLSKILSNEITNVIQPGKK